VIDSVLRWLGQHQSWGGTIALGIGAFVLSASIGTAVLVWLPQDFFVRSPAAHGFWHSHRAVRITLLVVKNLLGGMTFIAGAIMAIPFVPGPGLLFMLIGIGLLDFPGKRALERRLLRVPRVLAGVNRLRARFGKPPIATAARSVVDSAP
jgi:hypothetical protein